MGSRTTLCLLPFSGGTEGNRTRLGPVVTRESLVVDYNASSGTRFAKYKLTGPTVVETLRLPYPVPGSWRGDL